MNKKNYIKIIAWIGLMVFMTVQAKKTVAQDASFSQYYAAPLLLNPALSGNQTSTYFGANYRQKWRDKNFPINQMQFSAIHPIISKRGMKHNHLGGVGVSFYNETSGNERALKQTSVRLNAAYNLFFDRGNQKISFGINGGFGQRSFDYANLKWGTQYDNYFGYNPSIQSSVEQDGLLNDRVSYPVFGGGVMWFYSPKSRRGKAHVSYFAGFSAENLNQPDVSFTSAEGSKHELPVLYKVNAGINFTPASELFKISPNLLYQSRDGQDQLNIGAYGTYYLSSSKFRKDFKSLIIGAWYRVNDAFIMNVGYETPRYSVGVSYDTNTTYLDYNLAGGSALEVSLSYKLKRKKKQKFSTPMM
ncbi:PorP/SprF family type IX secretion system membrane protein [Aureibacter tunicatorum]|uniref:Type IX secretion system PorP/SprF family membrane protein n=1 Tax=Aureibacter tunicatorum TaxID=866807 RepID=A0AAE4BTA9_9BACT|nr:PorP/SprF family type IX secretion system membrane protein [Aureibacter tunicatorum]MDR6242004.1 type IX secretion system PorP/SprF family membrane protein [Aureibacter tunicatorum]BDD07263.1 hypothetical protein AUTU_47460 [Aureibacter tunicatorum]